MAYSHSRLRNTLALIRVLTGLMLLVAGAHKISSLEFAQIEFPALLRQASNGAAVGFYADFLDSVVRQHTGGWAVLIGLTELFIGVGLLLGLAVRPVSLVGIFYTVNFMLATCMAPGWNEPLWRYVENQSKLIMMFFLFLLFGIGHAGENWGVGSLYHHRRRHKWEEFEQGEDKAPPGTSVESFRMRYVDDDLPLPKGLERSEFLRSDRDDD